jgi:trk system potassium uptake protein TrkA
MRALIVGAGDVGYDIARMLARQKLDVVVVDNDPAKIEHVRDTLDVQALLGSGTSASTLSEAGISRVGLMVAVTDVDEVNIVAAMLAEAAAQRVGRACTTIARVRSSEFSEKDALLKLADFGIDHLIHPEQSAANEAVSLLRRYAATDVVEFADGQLQLVGIRVDQESPSLGQPLKAIAQRAAHLPFRVMGISRGVRTLVPDGDVRVQKNDQVFVLVASGQVPQVAHVFGKSAARLDHVMILGGSTVGALIAQRLCAQRKRRGGVSIKIVEPDRRRAEWLAERIEGAMVIHGDPSDIDLLVVEGIQETDAVVAMSQDEESNLVVCLMAKHLGVKKTVALLSKSAYVPISQAIGLDAAVSQKLAVSREVLRFLRGAHIRSVATVHGLDAEILEVEAGEGSPITKRPLMGLKLPRGLLVGAVVGGRQVEIATGQTQVRPGQRAIVFATPERVDEVEGWFGR